ncbi:MAG: FkbM family methyltransferase [Actinomycetota bacterium]|nr:FkbM family methyltransferase [Actinomycetota bacterium]
MARRLPPAWDRSVRELGKAALNYRGARAALRRRALFSAVGRYSPLLLASFGRGWLLVDANDKEVGRVVYATGGYERVYMESALQALSSTEWSVRSKTFLDIGANIGTSTVDALMHFGFERAICFEPDTRNLKLLEVNLRLNDLHDRASVHPVALSDSDGYALLERTAGNFGDTRVVSFSSHREGYGVRCRRLDDLVASKDVLLEDLGLVWIDVQGHEPFVLSGAEAVIREGIPTVIEYSPGALRSTGGLDLLESLIRSHYQRIVDVRLLAHGLASSATLDAADVVRLRDRYDAWDHTDLLLLR